MACTKEEYHDTLQRNLGRANTSRDEAVRMTNVHHGYGESTALQFDVPDTLEDKPDRPRPAQQPSRPKVHPKRK